MNKWIERKGNGCIDRSVYIIIYDVSLKVTDE